MAWILRGLIAVATTAALAACAGSRGPNLAEVAPIDPGSARPEPLPDATERLAARLAAQSLASREPEPLQATLDELRLLEGSTPTILLDDAVDLVEATRGPRSYRAYAKRMLASKTIDVELQRRLERHLASDPLAIAERRIREDRTLRFGQIFNQLASPAVNAVLGNPIGAIETGRAAILTLLVLSSAPELTIQQRQALRQYQRVLEQDPESPEAREIAGLVAELERRLQSARVEDAQDLAEKALRTGRPDAALLHLSRARRLDPDDPATQRLTLAATQRQRESDDLLRQALASNPQVLGFQATAGIPGDTLAAAVLGSPLADFPGITMQWGEDAADLGLEDELEFLAAASRMASGDEDGYFEAMRELARTDVRKSNMGRHALPLVRNGDPYSAFQRARAVTRRRTAGFVFLGSFASRPPREISPLLRPLAALIEIPSFAIAVLTTPLRIPEIGTARARFSGPVLSAGEEYLQRFPDGVHAEVVRADLEGRYAARGQWSQALVQHEGRASPEPERIAEYRRRIADRTLEAARLPRRADIRIALYQTLIQDYGDTPAGRTAAKELEELRTSLTPQSIRLSRKFLLENRQLTEPGALGLRAELLDGDDDNGEISDEGVLLIGRTFVRLLLEGRDPLEVELRPEAFARFVALLEQAYERTLRRDPRARPLPDPQRDQFFERARLGLLDQADFRLAAASAFEFLGVNERYGPGRGRESILPVELVVRGGLEDFGVAAVPRVRMPRETEDAFLYK